MQGVEFIYSPWPRSQKTPVRIILLGAKGPRFNMQTPYQQLILMFENDYWRWGEISHHCLFYLSQSPSMQR